jgi:hypothetical protein
LTALKVFVRIGLPNLIGWYYFGGMGKKRMLSATEYAEKIGKPYPTVAAWLRKGYVPAAKKSTFGKIAVWEIPEDAAYNEPPPGRPAKPTAENGSTTKASKKLRNGSL